MPTDAEKGILSTDLNLWETRRDLLEDIWGNIWDLCRDGVAVQSNKVTQCEQFDIFNHHRYLLPHSIVPLTARLTLQRRCRDLYWQSADRKERDRKIERQALTMRAVLSVTWQCSPSSQSRGQSVRTLYVCISTRVLELDENLITYKQSAQIETSYVLESWPDTDIMPDRKYFEKTLHHLTAVLIILFLPLELNWKKTDLEYFFKQRNAGRVTKFMSLLKPVPAKVRGSADTKLY